MQLIEEAMMHVHRRVEVGIGLIAALWAPEQLPRALFDALTTSVREPLALGATTCTILTGAVRVHFHGDRASREGFLTAELINLSP